MSGYPGFYLNLEADLYKDQEPVNTLQITVLSNSLSKNIRPFLLYVLSETEFEL